jgi:3-oxoacyl-[acyl-carrier protein] reductase
MEKSDQRVAMVIGASGGTGKAVALRFASERVAVVVHYNQSKEKADKLVEQIKDSGGKAIAVRADITQFSQAEALAEQAVQSFGRVDILAICAGGHYLSEEMRSLPRLERYRMWDQIMGLNVTGPMFCANAVYPQMVKQNYGRIVFVSSTAKNGILQAADYVDLLHRCSYAASKEGLVGITHTLANYLAGNNITVNCVVPGLIMDTSKPVPPIRQRKSLLIPMKRMGSPDEMAEAIVFLSSEKASYITGNVLYVSGGFMSSGFNPELVDFLAKGSLPKV